MLAGNESKINELDGAIKNIDKQKETLQTGMAKAMGIGSENGNKDILRTGGGALKGKPEFEVQQNKAVKPQFLYPTETEGKQDDGKDNKNDGGTGNPDNSGSSDNVNNKIIDALKSCDEKGNEPETLYVPGTFNDYVDRGDYKNPTDYYKTAEDHAAVYIKNDNGEGLQRFLKENKLDKDTSFKFWLGLNNKDGGDKGEKDTITADKPDYMMNVDISMVGDGKYITADDYINKYNELEKALIGAKDYVIKDRTEYGVYSSGLDNAKTAVKGIETDINTLKQQRVWSREKEKQYIFDEKTATINRKNYSSDGDYYKTLITKEYNLRNNGTPEEHDTFLKNNGVTDKSVIKNWSDTLKKEIGEDAYNDFIKNLNVPKVTFSEGGRTLPSINEGKGTINIAGEEIPVVPWSGQYEDFSDKVVDSYFTHKNDFNSTQFALGKNDMEGAYEFPKESDLIKGNEKAAAEFSGWQMLMDTILLVGSAVHSFDVTTDIVDINGQKRAVIKYYDSVYNFDGYNIGKNPLNLDTGIQITLDNRRETHHEFGYIYVENGKTMLSPLVYPGEKITKNGEDITYDAMKPVELPDELVKEIDDMLSEKGLYIDLPY